MLRIVNYQSGQQCEVLNRGRMFRSSWSLRRMWRTVAAVRQGSARPCWEFQLQASILPRQPPRKSTAKVSVFDIVTGLIPTMSPDPEKPVCFCTCSSSFGSLLTYSRSLADHQNLRRQQGSWILMTILQRPRAHPHQNPPPLHPRRWTSIKRLLPPNLHDPRIPSCKLRQP